MLLVAICGLCNLAGVVSRADWSTAPQGDAVRWVRLAVLLWPSGLIAMTMIQSTMSPTAFRRVAPKYGPRRGRLRADPL